MLSGEVNFELGASIGSVKIARGSRKSIIIKAEGCVMVAFTWSCTKMLGS